MNRAAWLEQERMKWAIISPMEVRKLRLQKAKAQANARRHIRVRSFILAAKNKPCVDCGKQLESQLMHFDHREPEHKLFNIAKSCSSFGWDKLKAEVNKCDIRCYLCHRIRSIKQ